MEQERPIRVCLVLEGSYPYITGGVSSWVQDLITNIPAIEFVLFTISPKKDQTPKYPFPANIKAHKDLVLSDPVIPVKQKVRKKKLLAAIKELHDAMQGRSVPDIAKLIRLFPANYDPYKDAINSDLGWQMITDTNLKKNPIYPFSDYFWSWKAAHSMIFNILSAVPPEADIYHAVSTGYAGLLALTAKIRLGKAFLLTEHGLYHKEREMELRKATFIKGYQRDMWIGIYNSLSRVCYQHADLSTSLFEYNRRVQISLGARKENTEVIPNGIDVPRFSGVIKEKKEGFHIGLVGRVVPIKDIKTFITMAKIVSDQIPQARFYCIGPTDEDPGYFEDCKLLVDSFKLNSNFTFTGPVDVREYYSFLDVLLLTSVREAQPLVILEAYAASVPVVSTRVGNVAEMLDYNEAYLASPKDAEKLAQGVLQIYQDPEETGELIKRNLAKVKSFYNKMDLYRKYLAIYQELARR